MSIKLNKILSMLLVAMFIVTITASAVSAHTNAREAGNQIRATLTTGTSAVSTIGGFAATTTSDNSLRSSIISSSMDTANGGSSTSGSNTITVGR
jgi:hypothetical protein